MEAVGGSFLLVVFAMGAWWLGGLLFDRRKRVHHFVCRLHRSSYPPHPEDWVITHHIRIMLVLIGLFFFSAMVGVVGTMAGLALAIMR